MSTEPKRKGTRWFGWCLDNLHDKCMVTAVSGFTCQCPCHHLNATHTE